MPSYQATKMSAVVVIEWQKSILFIRRPKIPPDPWAGHFSFPGGRFDPEDENITNTACREVMEEVGLKFNPNELKKSLLPLTTHFKGMQVQPFYTQLKEKKKIKEDKKEVNYSKWVPLETLTNRSIRKKKPLDPNNKHRFYDGIPLDDYYIWGITLQIIDQMFSKS